MASNSDRSRSGSASSSRQNSVERSASVAPRVLAERGVGDIDRPAQARMACCWSLRSRVIEILRGLAFSATGILSVRTPDS